MSTEPKMIQKTDSFWNTLETIPLKLSQKLKKKKINSYVKSDHMRKHHLTKFISPTPDPTHLSPNFSAEKFADTLQRLSEYKHEKLKIVNIVTANQTKNEMKESIVSMQKQFIQESSNIIKQRDSMYDQFSLSSKILMNTTESLLNQNNLCRVCNIIRDDLEYINDPSDILTEIKSLKEDLRILNEKSSAMQIVHKEYEEEALNAKRKVEFADEELEKIKNNQEAIKFELEKKYLTREKNIRDEISQVKASLDAYKLKIDQELLVRTMVEKRQHDFINELMTELKNMKMVLQHPTLRMKTYERLKESKSPTDLFTFLPKLTTQNLPAESFKLNSKLYLGYFSSRSNNSTQRTKSSLKT